MKKIAPPPLSVARTCMFRAESEENNESNESPEPSHNHLEKNDEEEDNLSEPFDKEEPENPAFEMDSRKDLGCVFQSSIHDKH